MGLYIILNYLKQNPKDNASDLKGTYIYFKFKAYLQTTLTLTKKAYNIKNWKAAAKLSYMPPDDLCEKSGAAAVIDTGDLQYDIKRAMKLLSPAQAEIINLYFYRGKTDLEISSMKQVTRQAVNKLKHEALGRLKELLREYA